MGDEDRELKQVEPRWCGDTRVHRSHQWIDEKKLPETHWKDPIPEQIEFEPEICRGVGPGRRWE